jgi:GNAT superfamily N-acetyltransferase
MNTPSQLRVRRATAADAAVLADLRFAFRSALTAPVESKTEFVGRCVPWMQVRLGDNTRWRTWILDDDTAPIGAVWLQLIEKLPNPGLERELHGYVTNLFVLPEHRGRGGGSLLLDALLSECRTLGVDNVFLWPTPKSRPLYERHGFGSGHAVMVREL